MGTEFNESLNRVTSANAAGYSGDARGYTGPVSTYSNRELGQRMRDSASRPPQAASPAPRKQPWEAGYYTARPASAPAVQTPVARPVSPNFGSQDHRTVGRPLSAAWGK